MREEELEPESPNLQWDDVAISLHFVEPVYFEQVPEGANSMRRAYEGCPILQSIELDLLAYAFQQDPPIESHCLNQEGRAPIPLQIVWPDSYTFLSEGREEKRRCQDTVRHAVALVSYSLFRQSGIRVWHLTLMPAQGSYFSELDLIRLIHLYDGRTEATNMSDAVRFVLPAGDQVTVDELLPTLVGKLAWPDLKPFLPEKAQLRGGTVAILAGVSAADEVDGSQENSNVLEILQATVGERSKSGSGAERFRKWFAHDKGKRDSILSLCGVVTGIFDFDELDAAEARDTLRPTYFSVGAFYRVHRCTLVCVADEDRGFDISRETVGISPYLILPHAVLIHNEELVDKAIGIALETVAERRIGIARLESALGEIERRLEREYLPNIFNYRTERVLYDRGAKQRGAPDRLLIARSRLEELRSRLDTAWEARRNLGQKRIAIMLAMVSVFLAQDAISALIGDGYPGWSKWALVGSIAVTVGTAVNILWGHERRG